MFMLCRDLVLLLLCGISYTDKHEWPPPPRLSLFFVLYVQGSLPNIETHSSLGTYILIRAKKESDAF